MYCYIDVVAVVVVVVVVVVEINSIQFNSIIPAICRSLGERTFAYPYNSAISLASVLEFVYHR